MNSIPSPDDPLAQVPRNELRQGAPSQRKTYRTSREAWEDAQKRDPLKAAHRRQQWRVDRRKYVVKHDVLLTPPFAPPEGTELVTARLRDEMPMGHGDREAWFYDHVHHLWNQMRMGNEPDVRDNAWALTDLIASEQTSFARPLAVASSELICDPGQLIYPVCGDDAITWLLAMLDWSSRVALGDTTDKADEHAFCKSLNSQSNAHRVHTKNFKKAIALASTASDLAELRLQAHPRNTLWLLDRHQTLKRLAAALVDSGIPDNVEKAVVLAETLLEVAKRLESNIHLLEAYQTHADVYIARAEKTTDPSLRSCYLNTAEQSVKKGKCLRNDPDTTEWTRLNFDKSEIRLCIARRSQHGKRTDEEQQARTRYDEQLQRSQSHYHYCVQWNFDHHVLGECPWPASEARIIGAHISGYYVTDTYFKHFVG